MNKLLNELCGKYTVPQEAKAAGIYPYYKAISSGQDPVVTMADGHKALMFGSNSYLGLSDDPRLKEAAIAAVQKYGTSCSGSRFLNGTLDIHNELEEKLAKFVGMEEAVTFSTGFQVNLGVVSALGFRGGYTLLDDTDHACIIDGSRLGWSTVYKFKHNDMDALEKKLKACEPDAPKLIVVDGVYSMLGDLVPLPRLTELAEQYNASVMIDDAHGLGVFGKNGAGTANHFGLTDKVDLIMGTFSKSLASIGGFIAADESIINWLRHTARTYIFSASNTPAATASALEALHILQEEPERIEALWDVTRYALRRFREAGFEIGETESPIIPLYVRDLEKTFVVVARAFEEGVFINPVIPPACAPSDTLVRYALMANHTHEQVDRSVVILKKVFQELGIIK